MIAARSANGVPSEPVELSELLDRLIAFIRRYVVVGEDELVILALFVIHTWTSNAAEATPYLVVESPEKASGKTRLLEVLALLCWEAWLTVSISESTLFRMIEAKRPTLLLDEVDALFKSNTDRTEPIRAVINAGNRRGVTIPRCVPPKFDVQHFSVYCPKVLAGIATEKLPETVRDRSIPIKMRRRARGEEVERFYYRHAEQASAELVADTCIWSEAAKDELGGVEPELPEDLPDRMADALEPLFAIADAAGTEWAKRARDSAKGLTKTEADDELGRGAQVLAAMKSAMGKEDAIFTEAALEAINADDELPFGGWSEGKGLDARGLAKLLRPYGVRRKSVRVGDAAKKGYHRDDLRDAWARYLSPYGGKGSQGSQGTQGYEGDTEAPHQQADVTDVTQVTHLPGMERAEGLRETPEGTQGPSEGLTLEDAEAIAAEYREEAE